MLKKRGYSTRSLKIPQLRPIKTSLDRFSQLVCRCLGQEDYWGGLGILSVLRRDVKKELGKMSFTSSQVRVFPDSTAFKVTIDKIDDKEVGKFALIVYSDLSSSWFIHKYLPFLSPYSGDQRLKYCFLDMVGRIIPPTELTWRAPFGAIVVELPDGVSFPFEIEFKYREFDSAYYLLQKDFKIFEDDFDDENLENWDLSDDADVEVVDSKIRIKNGGIKSKTLFFDGKALGGGWYLRLIGLKTGKSVVESRIGLLDYWALELEIYLQRILSVGLYNYVYGGLRTFGQYYGYCSSGHPFQVIFMVPKEPHYSYDVHWVYVQGHNLFDVFYRPIQLYAPFVNEAYLAIPWESVCWLKQEFGTTDDSKGPWSGYLEIEKYRSIEADDYLELDKIEVYELPGKNLKVTDVEYGDLIYEVLPTHLGELVAIPTKTLQLAVDGPTEEYHITVNSKLRKITPNLEKRSVKPRWSNPFVLSKPLSDECKLVTGVDKIEIEIKGREDFEQSIVLEPGKFYSFVFEAVELFPVSLGKNFKVYGNRIEGWFVENEPVTLVVADENGCIHTLHLIPRSFFNFVEY